MLLHGSDVCEIGNQPLTWRPKYEAIRPSLRGTNSRWQTLTGLPPEEDGDRSDDTASSGGQRREDASRLPQPPTGHPAHGLEGDKAMAYAQLRSGTIHVAADEVPELPTTREEAEELVNRCVDEHAAQGAVVEVDAGRLRLSTPGFVDELVRRILIDRRAASLVLLNAPYQMVELARASAENRGLRRQVIGRTRRGASPMAS